MKQKTDFKERLLMIHKYAGSYQKIKTRQIVDALYQNFTSWSRLEDFCDFIQATDGRLIQLDNDPAMVIGTAEFQGELVAIIAQQTPSNMDEEKKYNYGLVQAVGYGLAYNMMRYAEEKGIFLHTLIDTVGGDPFEESAGNLQSWIISMCIAKMIDLKARSISVIVGRGGSGGALAIKPAHKELMLGLAEYSVISASGCSAISFKKPDMIVEALEMLQPTADYMKKYGIIDEIIEEPRLDSCDYFSNVLFNITESLKRAMRELKNRDLTSLKQNLERKVNARGALYKYPRPKNFIANIQRWFFARSLAEKENTRYIGSPEYDLMRAARECEYKNPDCNPHKCNHEKDIDGIIIRPGCLRGCDEMEFRENYYTCPYCGRPDIIGPDEYIKILFEPDSFKEIFFNLKLKHIDPKFSFFDYSDGIKRSAKKTNSKEALIIGSGEIFGFSVALAVSDFYFMGGSMGSVVGEKFRLLVDYAIKNRYPLISVTATGGARMQEGTVALEQMAKTSAAVLRLKKANLPFISIFGHPTTGGNLASYAAMGDFIIAEKKASVSFAGYRVVKLTSGGRVIDPKTMTAEFFAEQGGIHAVVERRQLKSLVSGLLLSWLRFKS